MKSSEEQAEPENLNLFLSRKSGATEIFLIRHGDAFPGPEAVLPGGKYDDQPLSELGRKQAEAVAQTWGNVKFDAIYSSPYRRTLETATPLARVQGLEIQLEDDIREVQLGTEVPELRIPENADSETTSKALRARLDYIVGKAATTGYWSSIPGAEPSDSFRRRVVNAVDKLAQKHTGQRLALFSHGGAINVYLAELLGLKRDFFFAIPNTSIHMVRVAARQRMLLALNDISHLRVAGLITDI
jgi:broad specificity phosphatase PhoE